MNDKTLESATRPSEVPQTSPVLEAREVSLAFGATQALDGVTVEVRSGSITGIIGHNGAGKSTLVKILCGVYRPESGQILIDQQPVEFRSPADASDAGIALVFQEFSLIPDLTVAQNVYLRSHGAALFGRIDDRVLEQRTAALLGRLGSTIAPSALVKSLTLADRQIVEIAKALSRERRVLMLDEPTAALSAAEVERLFDVLRSLARQGMAIVFISHHLREVLRICDDVMVLRDGRVVFHDRASGHTIATLVQALLGTEGTSTPASATTATRQPAGVVLMSVHELRVSPTVASASFEVRRGEVLGIAGLLGSGSNELLEAIFGVRKGTGIIEIGGHRDIPNGPAQAIDRGIFLVPEDRRLQGLVPDHTVAQNIVMAIVGQLTRLGFVVERMVDRTATAYAKRLQVKGRLDSPVRELSGGNQQKVVLAKALATEGTILLLSEPTTGIDIGTAAEIVEIVRTFVAAGNSAIWVSADFDELIRASDRVLIMKAGTITGDLDVRGDTPLTEEALLHAVQ